MEDEIRLVSHTGEPKHVPTEEEIKRRDRLWEDLNNKVALTDVELTEALKLLLDFGPSAEKLKVEFEEDLEIRLITPKSDSELKVE